MMLIGTLAKAASDGHSLETRVETEQLADYLISHGVRVGEGTRFKALLEDVRKHLIDTCLICKHNNNARCDLECDTCETPCMCKGCLDEQKWEWRGI